MYIETNILFKKLLVPIEFKDIQKYKFGHLCNKEYTRLVRFHYVMSVYKLYVVFKRGFTLRRL